MSTTNFTNGVTLTDAGWFNDVDAAVYQGTFPTGATALTVAGATTLAVFNTIATTVNAFGAASVALTIGHASAAAEFPGGVKLSSTAGNTGLNYSRAGTFTLTATGPIGSTNATMSFIRIGNNVTLTVDNIQASGNSTAAHITFSGLPSYLYPVGQVYEPIIVVNNGSDEVGMIYLAAAGTFRAYRGVAVGGTFTSNAGTTGTYAFSVSYTIA